MSKSFWISSVMVLLAAACGEPAPEMTLTLHLDSALVGTTGLALYAFGPQRSDGIFLTCPELLDANILPADNRIDLLAQKTTSDLTSVVTLSEVTAGKGRLVYVEALDATNARIGAGCTRDVIVPSGEAVDVTVTVFAVR